MSHGQYRGKSHSALAQSDQQVGRLSRKVIDLGVVQGVVEIDLAGAEVFLCTLGGDITIRFINLPPKGWCSDVELRLKQGTIGASKVSWPDQGIWPGGRAHEVARAPNVLDLVGISVMNDGTWMGFPVEGLA